MKNKGKLCSIALASTALVFVFLILISAAASAAQVTKIGSGSDPAIYGNKVVWTNGGVIHVYDLTARTNTTVNSSAASNPDIYGNKLVWHDESSGIPRIAVYDISTAAKTYITQDVDDRSFPQIYGTRIVWSANDSVYLRDMSTSTQTKIGNGSYPDIYDTKVVYYSYTEDTEVDITIRMYDINTKKAITVNSYGDPGIPRIWGTKVIWADAYNHQGYIAMYDTSTKNIIDVTHQLDTDPYGNEYGASTGTHIAIQNDKIVYNKCVDDYEGVAGVYMYSIASGQNTLLYSYSPEVYTTPEVYDNTVVWGFATNQGSGTSDTGIYACDLTAESEKPTATFDANVTSGVAPLKVQFTSTTTGNPIDYYWVFEPSTSSDWNSHHVVTAVHTFTKPGVYTVNLTVTNDAGTYTATRERYITVTDTGGSAGKPVANFNSPLAEAVLNSDADHGIYENEVVSFFDNSTGSPTSWFWDFGDGNTSTQQNPTHVYGKMGGYTVNLTVGNSAGSDTISKYGYVLVGIGDEPASPAYFSSDVTSGDAPLTVTFLDDKDAEFPNYPIWRQWEFGDGVIQSYMVDNNESATPYATHVYEKPGKYSVTLYLDNRGGKSIITKYHYITVTDPNMPVANFSANVTSGTAPLVVLFTDTSTGGAPTSWLWDFNDDGQADSIDMNPSYVYTDPGTYTANLTISNANGTSSKTATITVLKDSNSDSVSSSSGGSGGGGGGSPEPAKNVEVKELSQAFITSGKTVQFDFTKNATCVVYVIFDAKRTLGKTTTIAEMLKGKSALVSELPSGEVYKSFNIWVGNGGIATSKIIENPVICFKVEKSWMQNKSMDPASITLNRYDDKKWEQIPVNTSGEDDKFLYFTTNVSGYSSFAITGTAKNTSEEIVTGMQPESKTGIINKNDTMSAELEGEQEKQEESQSTPGFEIDCMVACILCLSLCKRRGK